MNHKFFENWFSYICGVFGGGVCWINVNWVDAVPKILIAAASAALAGGMGYIGQLVTKWGLKRIKLFLLRLKK